MIKRQALLVGAFALGALALVVATVLWLSGNSPFRQELKALIHFQGGVAGLYVGAPVTFRGVPVGRVEDIGIEVQQHSPDARIPVRVSLNPDSVRFAGANGAAAPPLASLVQRGLRAKLVAQSFVTGQKAIDLDFVAEAAPQAALSRPDDDAALPEIPAVSDRFEALFDQVAQLPLRETVADLRTTLQTLNQALQDTRGTLESARGALDTAAVQVTAVATEGRRVLGVATSTMDELRTATSASLQGVNRLLETSRQTVAAAQPEVQATLAGAREAAESARLAMRRVSELTDPGAPLRGDLEAAVRDLAQAGRALREFSELIEERPNALVFGNRNE